jgi:hypothetical protein
MNAAIRRNEKLAPKLMLMHPASPSNERKKIYFDSIYRVARISGAMRRDLESLRVVAPSNSGKSNYTVLGIPIGIISARVVARYAPATSIRDDRHVGTAAEAAGSGSGISYRVTVRGHRRRRGRGG